MCLMAFVLFTAFAPARYTTQLVAPNASGGYLDASEWDFSQSGPIKLDGEWEFYWNQLLYPKDFQSSPKADGYMLVPSAWSGYVGNNQLTDKGFATYRLRVRLGDEPVYMGIKTVSIRMSYRMFIDGTLVLSSGNPASSPQAGYVTANVPHNVSFNPHRQ